MNNKTNPVVSLETRADTMTIGLDHSAEEKPAKYAKAAVAWANDQEMEYGYDNVPKSMEGTPYDELDGAAAFARACRRIFGMDPMGMNWGPNPPIMRQVQVQEFEYLAADFDLILESELNDPVIWSLQRVAEYLEKNAPHFQIPKYLVESDRQLLLDEMVKTLEIVGAPVKTIYVPWGAVSIPGLDGISVFLTGEPGEPHGYEGSVFRLAILGKRKDRKKIDQIVEAVTEELKTRSIFKGRCFVFEKGVVTFHDPFAATKPEELIFSTEMMNTINNEVFNLIRHSEEALHRSHSLLNSKIVAAGEPGTGKTEFTNWTAQEALRNGFTAAFMHPGSDKDLDDFKKIIARQTPVLGIIEDLESYMPDTENLTTKQIHEERSKLLARFDGGQTKGKAVLWLYTTNFLDQWSAAMARPGRTDTFLLFKPLDFDGFVRLLDRKIGSNLPEDIDYSDLWARLSAMSSSFLSSGLVQKSIKYTLGKGAAYRLTNDDMAAIIASLNDQWEWYKNLMDNESTSYTPTFSQVLDQAITPVLQREISVLSDQ